MVYQTVSVLSKSGNTRECIAPKLFQIRQVNDGDLKNWPLKNSIDEFKKVPSHFAASDKRASYGKRCGNTFIKFFSTEKLARKKVIFTFFIVTECTLLCSNRGSSEKKIWIFFLLLVIVVQRRIFLKSRVCLGNVLCYQTRVWSIQIQTLFNATNNGKYNELRISARSFTISN